MARLKIRSVLALSCNVTMLLLSAARADVLELKDGDRFSGTIESITSTQVVISTAHAGKIVVERQAIQRMVTEKPVKIAMANGERVVGTVSTAADGTTTIDTTNGKLQLTNAVAVVTVWLPSAADPTLSPGYAWKHALAFDILGKNGNSKAILMGGEATAVLSGPETDLKLYVKGAYGKTDGNVSDKRILGGIDFERRFEKTHAWYVRDDAQKDVVQGIRFRNALAGGHGYYFYKQENRDLRVRSGLGYTYTAYTDLLRAEEGSISLDLGLHYREQISKHAVWTTDVTVQPTLKDLSNYFLTHESKLSIPLTLSCLSQEFGLSNQYVSQPGADKEKLDTTYFTRTRLSW